MQNETRTLSSTQAVSLLKGDDENIQHIVTPVIAAGKSMCLRIMDLTGIDCGECPRKCPDDHAAACVMSVLQERLQTLVGPKMTVSPCGRHSLNIQALHETATLGDTAHLLSGIESFAARFRGAESLLIQMSPEDQLHHLTHTSSRIQHFAHLEHVDDKRRESIIHGKSAEYMLQGLLAFFAADAKCNSEKALQILTRERHLPLPAGKNTGDTMYWFNFVSPFNAEIHKRDMRITEADMLTETHTGHDAPRKILLWDVTTGADEMRDKLTVRCKKAQDFLAEMTGRGVNIERVSVLLQHPDAMNGSICQEIRQLASAKNHAMILPFMPQAEQLTARVRDALRTFGPGKHTNPPRLNPARDPTHRRHPSSPSKQYRSSAQY